MNLEKLYSYYKRCNNICTDSRKLEANDLFFALRGPNFDGNQYASSSIDKGALLSVVDDRSLANKPSHFYVEDTLKCLQELAQFHRSKLNIPIIGIAGSNGKTTTKELIHKVLSTKYRSMASPGNFNNEIGVPLSILMIDEEIEIAIIEMGARYKGDVDFLCKIAMPSHGIVTNTGKDHLETFKSLEITRQTNAEIFEYLDLEGGTGIVNIDNPELMEDSKNLSEVVTYGSSAEANVGGRTINIFPYLELECISTEGSFTISTQLTGKYNFENIMAAVAIGDLFGVKNSSIQQAINDYIPQNNRSQLIHINSITIILDAYNANPTSMQEAIENLDLIESENKVVVLGDMLELGNVSFEEHSMIVDKLKGMNLSRIVLVGEEFEKVKDKLKCTHFDSVEQAKVWWGQQDLDNAIVLIKGSRGIGLERILSPN